LRKTENGWHVPLGQPHFIYVPGQRHFGRVYKSIKVLSPTAAVDHKLDMDLEPRDRHPETGAHLAWPAPRSLHLMAANLVNSFSIIDDLVQLIINAIKHISGQRRQLATDYIRDCAPRLGVVRLQLSKPFRSGPKSFVHHIVRRLRALIDLPACTPQMWIIKNLISSRHSLGLGPPFDSQSPFNYTF